MPKQKTSKEAILAQAYAVFKEKGYHQTKLSDLAAACGLEKSHFYYYFKGKQAIMQEVLQFASQKMDEWVWSKAFNEAFTPEQRFRKMLENLRKVHALHQDGCLMGNTVLEVANTEPQLLMPIQAYFSRAIAAFECLFATRYGEREARALAEASLREIQGGLVFMKLYGESGHFYRALGRVEGYFLQQVLANDN